MSTPTNCRRLGYSMIELLLVIATLAVMFALVIPRMTVIRESSSLRAGRQQLAAAFSAARAAALQKGKTSTLTIDGNEATVTVRSGLAGTEVRVFGPVRLETDLEPLGDAPRVISYNGRGMMTNEMIESEKVFRYRLRLGSQADTLCISTAGVILPKGCRL